MYAIIPLEGRSILQFEHLVPFAMRHVLYAQSSLPRVHAVGATLLGQPIGIALAVRGWATPGTHDAIAPESGSARLLTLRVAPAYRRLGVGRALLQHIEQVLADTDVGSIICNFALPSESLPAIDALLSSAKWTPREVTMLQCRADHAMLAAPIMQEQALLPPEYQIVDWVDLSDEERDSIRERQRISAWYPTALDPFHYEPEMELLNSLALRLQGEIVGWLITRRTSELTMYYRCMFVREDLQKLGRAFALLYEAISRHAELVQSAPGYGEWSTPATLRAMCAFIRRRLEPFGTKVTEQYQTRKSIAGDGGSVASGDVNAVASGFASQSNAVTRIPAFDSSTSSSIAARVLSLRSHWIPREESIAIHTLGAMARFDAFDGRENYLGAASRSNTVLSETFNDIYEQLRVALQSQLNEPVTFANDWALPAFRIVSSVRGAHLPVAPVHCDAEHLILEPAMTHAQRPLSFSIDLSLDDTGAGVTIWELQYDQTIGLDTEETARLLDVVPKVCHWLERGELFVHAADAYHQTTPRQDRAPGAERITLEGHIINRDRIWQIFG